MSAVVALRAEDRQLVSLTSDEQGDKCGQQVANVPFGFVHLTLESQALGRDSLGLAVLRSPVGRCALLGNSGREIVREQLPRGFEQMVVGDAIAQVCVGESKSAQEKGYQCALNHHAAVDQDE